MNIHSAPRFAMLASVCCWGGATTLSKEALAAFPPLLLLAVQLATSVLFLLGIESISKDGIARLSKAAWLGILEPGVAYLCNVLGLAKTTASHAALLSVAEPLCILPLAIVFLGERYDLWSFVCALLAVFGVLLIYCDQSGLPLGSAASGDLLVIMGMFCAALYVVFSKRLNPHISPAAIARQQQSVGFLFVLSVLFAVDGAEGFAALQKISVRDWEIALLSGVVQYGLAFWFYNYAVRRLSAGSMAAFLNLIPVVGAAGGILFLHEIIGLYGILGATLTLLSVHRVGSQEKS